MLESNYNQENMKPALSDSQIVDLYWQRNEDAIRETDKQYGDLLFRVAYNILQDTQDSEECKNDAYFKAWNSIPPARPVHLAAFVAEISRNNALNRYKEKMRKKRVPSELTVSIDEMEDYLTADGNPETKHLNSELKDLINQYLATLSERQRYIFIGRFCVADTLEDIAGELGIHTSTVQREAERIKRKFRQLLERNDYDV